MKDVFLKKNTEGGTAGLYWEAGEVKSVNSYLADELVVLSRGDYEIVTEDETPETPAVETPESDGPAADADNEVEVPVEEPVKPKRSPGRPKKPETSSTE